MPSYLELGAIKSALEIHQGRFFKEHFPKGLAFSHAAQNAIPRELVTATWKRTYP
jgi:exoribonuclease-2